MSNIEEINQLRSALKQLNEGDLVPALLLMEMDIELNSFRSFHEEMDRKLMRSFIQRLNTIKGLSEIRKIILDYYSTQKWGYIDDYLKELETIKLNLKNRARDISKYQSDSRLLAFALHYYEKQFRRGDSIVNDINNHFFRFLFIIFCHPDYSQSTVELNIIEEKFSQLTNNHLIHFVKNDTIDFYRWAKSYMDDHNEKYHSTVYTPITDEEYRTTINIIFDKLFDENKDIYAALKDKLSNAWYQKKYRQKNKGKKPHYYALSKRAKEALHILAFKRNLSEEEVIENLINERYIKECVDSQGNSLY
ncbi:MULTISPECIES: hypothetical protein [unclassified Acinetobacter]|uniref:hypothetical protein n=1 Tax=unclassified Acinetobacter TaxID=196816 RepID=UPI001B575E62|nr:MULTISPECIES: hypothetical protein [unclassified Acinetobacter]MBP6151858.1 hypothetical protein [Candidatus Methylopumilus sp.]MCH7352445.1 hypothetical protein [Acinetobacter sp. NIPH 2023]MCH7359838.1 hypothetical protein [Acinetobacter sp. NIPH 2024]